MNFQAGIDNMMDRLEGFAGQAASTMRQIGDMGSQIGTLQQVVHLIRKGGNPMELITAVAKQNPQAQQMLGTLQGKSDAELKAYAENMAKSYGVNLNDVAKQLGVTLPM